MQKKIEEPLTVRFTNAESIVHTYGASDTPSRDKQDTAGGNFAVDTLLFLGNFRHFPILSSVPSQGEEELG